MNPILRLSGLLIAGLLVAGCVTAAADEPPPTPIVVEKIVEVPGPQPTPQIIEVPGPQPTPKIVEVPVVPDACLDAIQQLLDTNVVALGFAVDVFDAYLNYPDENLAQFGARVESLMDNLDTESLPEIDIDPCLPGTTTGASS